MCDALMHDVMQEGGDGDFGELCALSQTKNQGRSQLSLSSSRGCVPQNVVPPMC